MWKESNQPRVKWNLDLIYFYITALASYTDGREVRTKLILFGIIRLFVWSELRTIQLEVEVMELELEVEVEVVELVVELEVVVAQLLEVSHINISPFPKCDI